MTLYWAYSLHYIPLLLALTFAAFVSYDALLHTDKISVLTPSGNFLPQPLIGAATFKSFEQVISITREKLQSQYGAGSGELLQLDELLSVLHDDLRTMNTTNDYRVALHDVPEVKKHDFASSTGMIHMIESNGLIRNTTDTTDNIEQLAANLIKIGMMKIKKSEDGLLAARWEDRFAELATTASKHDVPCETQHDCDKLTMLMNACSSARQQCHDIYSVYNQVTNVMNQVMSVLCACIFIGPVHICALKNFPYSCVFPYQVFSTFISGSSSVWEVIKTLSSLCRMHGDPRLLPSIQ